MTTYNPTFNVSDFELRNYTNPYLSPDQKTVVIDTESRVNAQLDFLAQMLGWNGSNYWTNLATTVNQKRQLLGGTFGVYNSYIIPRVYEIRNWNDTIVVDQVQFLRPGKPTQVIRVLIEDQSYQVQSVEVEGDKYVVSMGPLPEKFYTAFQNNAPLRVDLPSSRPAPFNRPTIGASGDYTFSCGVVDGQLVLYPRYDLQHKFPFKFPVLFQGSTYYFDQPIYLSKSSSLVVDIPPVYLESIDKWVLQIPSDLTNSTGITAFLVWANSNSLQASNYSLAVNIVQWVDPSDWKSINILNNFHGVWGNKGGSLPFNFAFDALDIHGFDEKQSVFLPNVQTSLKFNDIVNFIYYQKTTVSQTAPGGGKIGDIWWNENTGALSVWLPLENQCQAWVEIDYRNSPRQPLPPQVTYANMAAFRASSGTLTLGTLVRIDNIQGLTITDNVLGVQGTLTQSGYLILHSVEINGVQYWAPDEFGYLTTSTFDTDAKLLPFRVPVKLFNATGLQSNGNNYSINNLKITISGDYEVLLIKYYSNTEWEIYPDSLLKYIAFSSLFGTNLQGQMWWDFTNSDPDTRSAAIFYSSPSAATALTIQFAGVNLPNGVYNNVPLVNITGSGGKAIATITVAGGIVTGVSLSSNGDHYQIGDILGPNPATNAALVGATFQVSATATQQWADVNFNSQSGPPTPTLNLSTVLFYCDGNLLTPGMSYVTNDFDISYTHDAVNGQYNVNYVPLSFVGKAKFPRITISDNLTTTYQADITNLVFSGVQYYMSPNVLDAETPLRLWKAQSLQAVNNAAHLAQGTFSNPLIADLNNGPGPLNWEKYFVRLPLNYSRNEVLWQKTALICQNFGYWGSTLDPERMGCPPEENTPAIYEELFLYDQPVPDYSYVYCEPYLYSNLAYSYNLEEGNLDNSGIFPATDVQFDGFDEANTLTYEPLHERKANTTTMDMEKFGNWEGSYVNINPCAQLTGFLTTDLVNHGVDPVLPPIWDASIYKYAPTCEFSPGSYNVDSNHYKIGYAYFVADASAAEDAFFDISQEASWRYPVNQPKTSYLVPR